MDFIILILQLHSDKKTMTTLKDFIEFCNERDENTTSEKVRTSAILKQCLKWIDKRIERIIYSRYVNWSYVYGIL